MQSAFSIALAGLFCLSCFDSADAQNVRGVHPSAQASGNVSPTTVCRPSVFSAELLSRRN